MTRLLLFISIICIPVAAFAHNSSIGDFQWSIFDPFDEAAQILPLLALALLMQQNFPTGAAGLHGYWIACIAGIGAAYIGIMTKFYPEKLLMILAILSGFIATTAIPLPRYVLIVLNVGCGLLSGFRFWPIPYSGHDLMLDYLLIAEHETKENLLFIALGSVIVSNGLILSVAFSVELMSRITNWPWISVAVRIAASWITAISILLAALSFRTS